MSRLDRGNYRSIHTVIVDGPDFQALSPGAKLVWYTLKMTLGPSGIDVVPALVGTLMERTGLEAAMVEKGLAQLEAAQWIQRERNVVWMVEGLRHDPHTSLDNQNHRANIAKHLNGLPRLAIVDAFRAHYGFSAPPSEMTSTPAGTASNPSSEMPSKKASNIPSPIREKGEGKGKRETEKGKNTASAATSAAVSKSRVGRPTWLTPFANAWRSRYGGEMSAGRAVQSLAKLVDTEGADEVLRRWVIYLDATPAEYANAPKFAQTWGRWERPVLRRTDAPPSASGTDAVAETAWQATLALLPKWQRREVTAETFAEMVPAMKAAISAIGGFQQLATAAEDRRVWIKRDFLAAYQRAAQTPTAASQEAQSA